MGCGDSCADDDVTRSILLLGTKGAGKTTLLDKIKGDGKVNVFETKDFTTQSVMYNGMEVRVWDLGQGERTRSLWRHYFDNAAALCFIVDGTDVSEEQQKAQLQEIKKITEEPEIQNVPVALLVNKKDASGYSSPEAYARAVNFYNLKNPITSIFGISALKNEGIKEAFDWVFESLGEKKK